MTVSPSHIQKSIETLSATPRNSRENTEQHTNAANWIAGEFGKLGIATTRQDFVIPKQSPNRSGTNIIGALNPHVNEAPVLIGAHYDTVPGSPGADDNTSGVAAMLECARVLVQSNSARRVNFVAFDAEEMQPPAQGLHGSTAYVAELTENNRPSSAIILETIGFSSKTLKQRLPGSFRFLFRRAYDALKSQDFEANSLLILSKSDGRQISRKLEGSASEPQVALPILPLEVPWWMPLVRNLRRSDHAPFWKKGIPAVMISDTANFRNPNYHRPSDTVDTVDIDMIAKATQMILNAIQNGAI